MPGDIPTLPSSDDELPRGRTDSHRAWQVHGDTDGDYKIWCQSGDLFKLLIDVPHAD